MPSIRTTALGLLSGLVLLLPALALPALGQTAPAPTAYVAENAPYSIRGGEQPGFCVELVNEMAKLLKTNVTYEFMNWNEAQAKVKAGHDLFIFPFTRTPEREQSFGWLQKLFDVNAMFISKPGSAPVDTVEQAKALPFVGVNEGSAWDKELVKRGFANIKRYLDSRALVAAIKSGELPAAFGPSMELQYAWHTGGYQGALVLGKLITKQDQFLAMSKDSPSINPSDWQEAFGVLQQDGTFDRVYASYFGTAK
jgi:polar amino acid transport system substrate-binding protein